MSRTQVYDLAPAQLRRMMTRQPATVPDATPAQEFGIVADMADGIEATHQCLNLAGFSERPRAFILTLCDAALAGGDDYVELYDEALAELQNCSTRTVRRQRHDYLAESHRLQFSPVEVVEGKFDEAANKYLPTRYRVHLGAAIEQSVREARASPEWHQMDRHQQRQAIKRAAAQAFDQIPDAVAKRRRKRRPRLATAEIATCRKVINTKLERLKEMTEKLPAGERQRLTDAEAPGELYEWWTEKRAEMDAFFGLETAQSVENNMPDSDSGQVVRYPPGAGVRYPTDEPQESVVEAAAAEPHSPVDVEAWAGIEERMTEPRIRCVNVSLRASEKVSREASAEDVSKRENQHLQAKHADKGAYGSGLTEDVGSPVGQHLQSGNQHLQGEPDLPDEIVIPADVPNDEQSIADCLEEQRTTRKVVREAVPP